MMRGGPGLWISKGNLLQFDPAHLFASGGAVGWVEPMIPGVTLFQDAAGTIPVTAPGQPVGLSKFTAGGQPGFVQATALNRPIYQIDAQGRGYLAHNGVNQWMSTAAFAWGSDEVTICAGVRKETDPTYGTIFAVSTSWAENAGTWIMSSRASPTGYVFFTRGTVSLLGAAANGYSAPRTDVLTAYAKIATRSVVLRLSGAQVSSPSGSMGTGNFGAHAIFAGADGGGASSYLNGRRYPSVAINRGLAADDRDRVEAWVNQRTGAF